jgi:excisionase family DNA binding protein
MNYLKTTKEVAKMLNCTKRNVSHLVKAKKLKPISILENGNFLFNCKDVEYYLISKENGK